MKTPIIIALSLVGVLGTAGAAMAVNSATLAGVQQSNLGNAPTSITPSGSPTPSDDRTEHATPEPGDDNGVDATPTPSPSASHDVGDDHGGLRGGSDDNSSNSGSGSGNSGSGSGSSGSGHSGSDDSGSGHGGGHGSDD